LTDSGVIQNQTLDGFTINYLYDLQLQFDQDGNGRLLSVKQQQFSKE